MVHYQSFGQGKKLKLLISSDLAPPYIGGGESYVINLASRLVKIGHEVHWLTSKIPGTKSNEIYEGIHIHRIPIFFSRHYIFPGRQTFFLTSIATAIKLARKMDVVQTNTLVPGVSGWFIAKYAGKPSLLFCHEFFGIKLWRKIGHNLFEKSVYPLMEKFMATAPYDWFACPSQYSKKTMLSYGTPAEKITVIPHGIDFKIFNPKANGEELRRKFNLEDKKLIGYTGRLKISGTGQSKNLLMLLKALKIVVKKIPDAVLVLGGSNFEEISKVVNKLNIKKYVFYAGSRPYKEVPKFMAMTDVMVCPAISEGFCFMLAEASACGKPVVAVNAGAHPDRVINNKTGILTSASPESLAEGIIKILENPSLAKRFGKNGAKFAKQFTWEKSVKKHLEIYEMLVKSKT
jgi:glycosyltransferase involved in cell wall biosynthesis